MGQAGRKGARRRIGDSGALAENLIRLARNREELKRLTSEAANGHGIYNDEAVFAHRSELIKRFL
jgi:hypothetical protein